jgi:hypothetical protein
MEQSPQPEDRRNSEGDRIQQREYWATPADNDGRVD